MAAIVVYCSLLDFFPLQCLAIKESKYMGHESIPSISTDDENNKRF